MKRPLFILASASPRRLALLRDVGYVPDKVMAADIDETPHHAELPQQLAKRLALEKLDAFMSMEPNACILAADTVVACGRRLLPKAVTPDEVRSCWQLLSGRRHHVFTAVAIGNTLTMKIQQIIVKSVVTVQRVTQSEIEEYVNCNEGIGKAGGYGIQGRAAAFIRYMAGSYSNIVGLPLHETVQMLRRSGLS